MVRMHSWLCVRCAAISVLAMLASGRAEAQSGLALQLFASGLANPVALANAGDGSMRLFIVEQAGTIRIHNGAQVLPTAFLDITAKVLSGGERGLLGVAFDPSYAGNGFFYVFYTSQPAGQVTIARYSVTADPNVANPQSELILKTQPHPDFGNHNGGGLAFGPDGCLYAGIGDGGGGGDPGNNGQNLGTLLGKVIRISKSDGAPCAGNPFVGTPGARGEIWALGLRNPWRITFDRQTGDLFIADVGQGAREEVNFQPAGSAGGRNYCWRRKEGTLIFDANVPCTTGTPTDPVLEYDHSAGNCSITGGYRYRGSQFSTLAGTYFYGDFCTGRIWGANQNGSTWTSSVLLDTTLNISSFGEDEAGEIYVAHLSATAGAVYRLVATNALQVSPASNVVASGLRGGPFSPSSFAYAVSTTSGSMNFAISIQFDPGVPSWLTATPVSGTATPSPVSATFAINAAANGLAPGTYNAAITFTNTTNGVGTQGRSATLIVNAPIVNAPSCTMASQLGDFGGDGRSDLLFRHTNGQLALYQMNGFQIIATQMIGSVGVEWTLTASGDFSGDGKTDMLFRHSDGTLLLYLMNGPQVLAAQVLGAIGPDWEFVGAEDFNGDGKADMLFRRTSDGMLVLYLMNGFQVVAAQLLGAVGTDWRVRGVRDFSGDGRADILFRRRSDGMLALYLMNGFEVVAAQLLGAIGTEWDLLGVRDFNGDARADMLFRHSDGTLLLYLVDGFRIVAAQVLGTVGPEFKLLGVGDLNGDGHSDMVLRRTSDGMLSAYLMNGFQIAAFQLLGAIGTDWDACYSQPPLAMSQVSQR
jgi:glucose/arabinose dehydrogenase